MYYEDDSKPIISDKVKAMSLEELLSEISKKEEGIRQRKLSQQSRDESLS
jgi:hypothetical protein